MSAIVRNEFSRIAELYSRLNMSKITDTDCCLVGLQPRTYCLDKMQSKLMNRFLCDRDLNHERVQIIRSFYLFYFKPFNIWLSAAGLV